MCAKLAMGYTEAHRILNAAHKRHNNRAKKIPQRVYFCPECKQWHLTSQKHERMETKTWK